MGYSTSRNHCKYNYYSNYRDIWFPESSEIHLVSISLLTLKPLD